MQIKITQLIPWSLAHKAALHTVGKSPVNPPTRKWIKDALLSEHSMCRVPTYEIVFHDIAYFSAMHLVRHKHGCEWFVRTSREDRTGVPRDERKQTDLVDVILIANAQALVNISKKRLCNTADKDTKKVWLQVRKEMYMVDKSLHEFMQPACWWQNACHEFKSCGLRNKPYDYGEENYTAPEM